MLHLLCLLLLVVGLVVPLPLGAAPQLTFLDLRAVAPPGVTLDEIWGATGVDPQGRLYVAISSRYGDPPGDVAIFRYTPRTNTAEFLTTLRTVSQAQGNLQPNERIAKVHTHILTMNGKLYMGSHDFHGGEDPATIRGAHLYSYDPGTNTWEDLSAGEPGGVSAPHEGIIGLDVIPGTNHLGGITYPQGQLLVFDLATKRATRTPAPSSFAQVSRQPWGSTTGALYATYLPAGPPWSAPVWRLTTATRVVTQVQPPQIVASGVLHRAAHTRDETRIYLKDELGGLYGWEEASEHLTALGSALPSGGDAPSLDNTLILSNDEAVLFSLPADETHLYQHVLATGAKSAAATFPALPCTPTGGVVDQAGGLYFGCHDYTQNGATLLRITGVTSSPPASSTGVGTLPPPTNLRLMGAAP